MMTIRGSQADLKAIKGLADIMTIRGRPKDLMAIRGRLVDLMATGGDLKT